MTTDLHPDSRLENRLRDAFDVVIPLLMDDADGRPEWVDKSEHAAAVDDRFVTPRRRSGLLGIAAAVLVIGGGAAVWSTTTRPEPSLDVPTATNPSATRPVDGATSTTASPVGPGSTVSTSAAGVTSSSVPCLVEGCPPVDRLPVVDGALELFAGPESLGAPTVDRELLNQFGLVRCLELTADGSACQRVEGLAGVGPMSYPDVGVEIGTTYTTVSAADYVAQWSVTGSGPAPTEDIVVRGHDGIRFVYGDRTFVVWPEREGVLAWVAAPNTMPVELLSIAEGIRTIDGPTSIPFVVVTGLGSRWDASDNDSDGVVYARIGDALCVGIGSVSDICSQIVTRTTVDGGALQIAAFSPSSAKSARVVLDDGTEFNFELMPVQGIDAGGLLGALPLVDGSLTLAWLDADGTELAGERIDVSAQVDSSVPVTTPAGAAPTVLVANASDVAGAADSFTQMISGRFGMQYPVNALEIRDRSIVYFAAGFESVAQDIADELGGADLAPMPDTSAVVEAGAPSADVLVLVGNDHAAEVRATVPTDITTTTGG